MRETQHPRTQLAWGRTGLSVVGIGLVEVRLLLGPDPDAALWALGGALSLAVLVGVVAAVRLRRNVDALEVERVTTGGRAPLTLSVLTVAVGVLGLATIAVEHRLLGF